VFLKWRGGKKKNPSDGESAPRADPKNYLRILNNEGGEKTSERKILLNLPPGMAGFSHTLKKNMAEGGPNQIKF